jgi:tRNA pseudouridine55 synthase
MDGLLIIDKPVGPTSHDVVARLRRTLREGRIGHTGTLDPAASGLLALVLGRATRLARFIACAEKRYVTVVRLGIETDTYDAEGTPVASHRARSDAGGALCSRDEIDRALDAFRGTFHQRPPVFSAKKIGGTRSYKLARANGQRQSGRPLSSEIPAPAPVPVTAHAIDILDCTADTVTLSVVCSAGFYIRSLAHDVGEALGVGAHVLQLRRTRTGDLDVADALPLALAEADPDRAAGAIVPLARMLPELGAAVLTETGARHAAQGRNLGAGDVAERLGAATGSIRLIDPGGMLVGIAEAVADSGLLHPSVILM